MDFKKGKFRIEINQPINNMKNLRKELMQV